MRSRQPGWLASTKSDPQFLFLAEDPRLRHLARGHPRVVRLDLADRQVGHHEPPARAEVDDLAGCERVAIDDRQVEPRKLLELADAVVHDVVVDRADPVARSCYR
jgi:hypothetical protein